MWFQHDEAHAHYSRNARNYVDVTFGQQCTGRNSPVYWPDRSPDLSYLNFYFWDHMKTQVYDTPVGNSEELGARISVDAGEIRDVPVVCEIIRINMRRRCTV